MKILTISPLFHPHIGGVEKHVKRLSEELIRDRHEVSIITIKHDKTLEDSDVSNGIDIYRFPKMKLPQIWYWIYKHRGLIKDADVVHCHDFSTFIFWYFPFRLLYPLKPVFVTFHGHEGILPIPKNILFLRRLTEFLTKGNICIGDFIPKWYGTKADFISYGGVDEPDGIGNMGNKNSAVYIGRLEKDTGIMTYINAVGILKRKYGIDIQLDICGDGSLHAEIEKNAAKNNLNVKLHGFVENPVDYLIKDQFAFVSGYLAILEAMINKKLVFSLYENELKRDYLTLIPDAKNIMVIVSSAEDLADELVHYLKNANNSENVINNAYDFAKKQTWENMAKTYLHLWKVR